MRERQGTTTTAIVHLTPFFTNIIHLLNLPRRKWFLSLGLIHFYCRGVCVLVRLHGVPVETEKSILIEQKPFVGNFWESSSEEGLGSPWNCCRLVGRGKKAGLLKQEQS